jgi:hypothetical protein
MKIYPIMKYVFILSMFVFLCKISESQVLISSSSGTPNASSMLEIRSTTQGLLIPRMTTGQRNAIATPAAGLLVYDLTVGAFFLRNSTAWVNLSSSSEIWSQNSTGAYLSNTNYNLAVGTDPVLGKKVVIKADPGKSITDPLFEIQDQLGKPIMRVTSEGVRFYVKSFAKGSSGGFAVGKYGIVKEDSAKGANDLLLVNYNGTRVYTDGTGGTGSGFAVGQYDGSSENYYFSTQKDSTRVYAEEALKGTAGGFAVGKYGIAKYGGKNNYLYMLPKNYFIGHQAGNTLQNSVYTGLYNTFFGYKCGYKDQTGSNNVFVGYQSGMNNVYGNYNVFLGNETGFSSTGHVTDPNMGARNLFLGYQAGYSNTTGSDNVLLGYQSGYNVTTAGNNISIGSQAGFRNTNNSDNIFLGRMAGYNHIGDIVSPGSKVNNIYMGFQAGYGAVAGETGANNVYMGTSAGYSNTSGVNNLIMGYQSGYGNTSGSNNVIMGTNSGYINTTGLNF